MSVYRQSVLFGAFRDECPGDVAGSCVHGGFAAGFLYRGRDAARAFSLRRLCVWAGMLGVLALTCMVGVLWDVYFNVLSSVTAVAVGGLGALFSPGIHASAHAADALAEEGKKEDEGS